MPTFNANNYVLSYQDQGSGEPVVMLHGFGMSAKSCWGNNGWYDFLNEKGYRAVALDSRGHGESALSKNPTDYEADKMTKDVIDLLDHLGIGKAHFMGHSMGGRTMLNILLEYPERIKSAVGVSIGSNVFEPVDSAMLKKALLATDMTDIPPVVAKYANEFISAGNDKYVLAACLSSPRPVPKKQDLHAIKKPCIIVCSTEDPIVGDPTQLASEIPGAKTILVSSCSGHSEVLATDELRKSAIKLFRSASSN